MKQTFKPTTDQALGNNLFNLLVSGAEIVSFMIHRLSGTTAI